MLRQIFLVIMIILLGASSYYLYTLLQEMNAPPIALVGNMSGEGGVAVQNFSSIQFYPDMRFASPSVSYNISNACDNDKRARIIEAFGIISNISAIRFYPAENAQIAIECNETSLNQIRRDKYYIAGEGGPTSVINTSLFYIIQGGEVLLLYPKSSCNYPTVEVHELLHVFGFQHSANPDSIMYPTSMCNQRITPEIEDTLNELYATPEEADLYFVNASVVKHGSYIDFTTNVENRGLNEANNIILEVYADNTNVKNYTLDSINIGEGKYLEVQNLRVGLNINSVRFIVSDGKELYYNNNMISFSVPSAFTS